MSEYKSPPYRFLNGLAAISSLALFLAGCAPMDYPERSRPTTPPPPLATPERPPLPMAGPYKPVLGKAASLYRSASTASSAGNYARAEQLLERALRIEPKNSYYWYQLAKVKFARQQYSQVIQFCLKSKSMAGGDDRLRQMNDQLIGRAQNQM